MNTTDPEGSNSHTPCEDRFRRGRMSTEEGRADLIEDAKAFKRRHEKTFQLLSESYGATST